MDIVEFIGATERRDSIPTIAHNGTVNMAVTVHLGGTDHKEGSGWG